MNNSLLKSRQRCTTILESLPGPTSLLLKSFQQIQKLLALNRQGNLIIQYKVEHTVLKPAPHLAYQTIPFKSNSNLMSQSFSKYLLIKRNMAYLQESAGHIWQERPPHLGIDSNHPQPFLHSSLHLLILQRLSIQQTLALFSGYS